MSALNFVRTVAFSTGAVFLLCAMACMLLFSRPGDFNSRRGYAYFALACALVSLVSFLVAL